LQEGLNGKTILQSWSFFINMNDFMQTILQYLLILIILIIALKIIIPVIMGLLGWLINIIIKITLYGAIIFVLYLLGKFIYESYKNNS